jgi:carbon storage regulator CsrA
MLVLSRKAHQSVQIDGQIKITILHVRGNSVRIGIEAPEKVRIIRSELDEWGPLTLSDSEIDNLPRPSLSDLA